MRRDDETHVCHTTSIGLVSMTEHFLSPFSPTNARQALEALPMSAPNLTVPVQSPSETYLR